MIFKRTCQAETEIPYPQKLFSHSYKKMYILLLRGSVVVKALYYKQDGREFETRRGEWMFSIYWILPVSLCPGIHSASNRNEYQKQINVSEE
jgi:hypothetical protein